MVPSSNIWLVYVHMEECSNIKKYSDTYSPVVNWASIRLIMTFALLNKMHSPSIDFTLVFPQADTDVDIFVELPIGVDAPNGEVRKDYVLYLLNIFLA